MFRYIPLRSALEKSISSQKCLNLKPTGQASPHGRSHSTAPSRNAFTERSHTCGELGDQDIGKQVRLLGWVHNTRFDNKFLVLRDSYGSIQCILGRDLIERTLGKRSLYNESIVEVVGTLAARPSKSVKRGTSSGHLEVVANDFRVLSSADEILAVHPGSDTSLIAYPTRLKHRYLDLRSSRMQHALRFRSKVARIIRNKLNDLNFVECETPTLLNRTPGGANEFVVPTREEGKFYSLVQSPQQLKQLLMVGGIDRYYQFSRCFRDESGRSDRQPEFTQVDIELSFTNQAMVMELVESLVKDLLEKMHWDEKTRDDNLNSIGESFTNNGRLQRLTYSEAFRLYGTDKPDTRFGWLIKDQAGQAGLSIEIPNSIGADELNSMVETWQDNLTQPGRSKPEISLEALSSSNSVAIRTSTKDDNSRRLLGTLRVVIARKMQESGLQIYNDCLCKFLWITDFPLFALDDEGSLQPNHHPFTAPTPETASQLSKEPLKVIGQHYDLVLNGNEIAGGSIRIHDAELQRYVLEDLMLVPQNKFDYFLKALRSGCPPHGGIAFGLDRLVATLLHRKSIDSVIAFPKSTAGRDLMTNCPEEIPPDVKQLYHIKG